VIAVFWLVNLSEIGRAGNLIVDVRVSLEGIFEEQGVKR
jgi:hypothetical protein